MSLALIMITAIITGLIVAISIFIEYFVSIFEILFKKPLPPRGAVEIDAKEHIYAHPDYVDQLQDPRTFDVKTIYEVCLHGLKLSGDRPQFSYRQSSDQPFKYYTYK